MLDEDYPRENNLPRTYGPKCNKLINNYDAFGIPPPHFNIEGRKKVTTAVGLILTVFASVLTITFAVSKILYMIEGRGAIITSMVTKYPHVAEVDAIDPNNFEFKIAFSVQNARNVRESYDDPTKVRWVVENQYYTGSSRLKTQYIGVHKCTSWDYGEFYPPVDSHKSVIEELKYNGNFYCMDDVDIEGNDIEILFYGSDESSNQHMSVLFTACDPIQLTESNAH